MTGCPKCKTQERKPADMPDLCGFCLNCAQLILQSWATDKAELERLRRWNKQAAENAHYIAKYGDDRGI